MLLEPKMLLSVVDDGSLVVTGSAEPLSVVGNGSLVVTGPVEFLLVIGGCEEGFLTLKVLD